MSACHDDNYVEKLRGKTSTSVKIRELIRIPRQGTRGFIGVSEGGTTGALDNVWNLSFHHGPSRVNIIARALSNFHIRCDLWTKAEVNLKMLSKERKS